MISEPIRIAITALVDADASASDADRERVKIALGGMRPDGPTVRIEDAAKALGVHKNTVLNWARAGRLTAVRDAGGRIRGVTQGSVARA